MNRVIVMFLACFSGAVFAAGGSTPQSERAMGPAQDKQRYQASCKHPRLR